MVIIRLYVAASVSATCAFSTEENRGTSLKEEEENKKQKDSTVDLDKRVV